MKYTWGSCEPQQAIAGNNLEGAHMSNCGHSDKRFTNARHSEQFSSNMALAIISYTLMHLCYSVNLMLVYLRVNITFVLLS